MAPKFLEIKNGNIWKFSLVAFRRKLCFSGCNSVRGGREREMLLQVRAPHTHNEISDFTLAKGFTKDGQEDCSKSHFSTLPQ